MENRRTRLVERRLTLHQILISACVYGSNVRWNGTNRKNDPIKVWAKDNSFELVPVCPEDELFSTPRSPIRMSYDSTIHAISSGVDVYDELIDKCEEIIDRYPNAVGFIGIANSPSCGQAVGVKNLGNVIKGPMHMKSRFPTTEISSMNTEKNRDMFLSRIKKYIANN